MNNAKNFLKKIAGKIEGSKKIRSTVIILAFAVLLSATGFIQVAYAVSVNGEKIGYVASKEEAEQIIDNVEEHASEILGAEYSLENKVKVASVFGNEVSSESRELEQIVFDSVEEIEELCGVYVDNELVAAVANEEIVDAVLEMILSRYSDANMLYARIQQDVETEYTYFPASLKVTSYELANILNPENEESDYALDVLTAYIKEEKEVIPFETVKVASNSMFTDQTKVISEGVNGEKVYSYYVSYVNGVEYKNLLLEEEVTVAAVNEEVAYGTQARPKYSASGSYIFPTNGQISSYFGYRNVSVGSTYHKGIDICGSSGQAIWAAAAGEVTFAGWNDGGYGYLVVITHDNGEQTYYAHCSSVAVSVGQRVEQGEVVSYMGATGTATGVHLHFEIRVNGTPIDPLTCL